jgi:hypothetical protein
MGGLYSIESYSEARDVEIIFLDTANGGKGLGMLYVSFFRMISLRIAKGSGTKVNTGIQGHFVAQGQISNCEFENFDAAIRVSRGNVHISGCNYLNCTNGVYGDYSSFITHNAGSGSGLDYGLTVNGGIIVKMGTQPTGSIANERVLYGQII